MRYVEAVDARVIRVPVVVTDGGKFVRGLTRKDFSVREDGVPQQVTFFAAEDSPLEVVVAVDVSGSMVDAIPTLKLAVKQFLTALRPTDRVTVLGFNDMVFTLAKNAVDLDERLAAIDELSAWGGTAMYDAAIRALGLLGKRPGRKALVMFTDGEDRVSRMTEDDAGARLETGNVMFYAVGQGQADPSFPFDLVEIGLPLLDTDEIVFPDVRLIKPAPARFHADGARLSRHPLRPMRRNPFTKVNC